MIRISPQQKQRAFSLFFSARKRGELETFEPMEGVRLAHDPQGVYLLAADDEIWACHPTQGAALVGEVKENGAASIDIEVCPNWDHHTTDWCPA